MIPVILGPRIPRNDRSPEELEEWSRSILILFIPWRHPADLKQRDETWTDAYRRQQHLLLIAKPSLARRPYNPTAAETCISLLQSRASSLPDLAQIHAFALRRGVAPADAAAGKHLVFAAVSLSAPMPYAERVFAQLHRPDAFTWNTMIRGFADD